MITARPTRLATAYAKLDSGVRVLPAFEKAGQSHGRNVGVRETSAPFLAFCDADDLVAPGWIAAIAEGLQEHEVVTGPHELDLLNPPGSQTPATPPLKGPLALSTWRNRPEFERH